MSALHTTIGNAIVTAIQGLSLSGIPGGNVLLLEVPTDRTPDVPALPAVVVANGGESFEEVGDLTGSDDWVFPFLVSVIDSGNRSVAWSDTRRQWLESVVFLFHNKKLAGVPLVYRCFVTPKKTVDVGVWSRDNLSLAQVLVEAFYRRVRT